MASKVGISRDLYQLGTIIQPARCSEVQGLVVPITSTLFRHAQGQCLMSHPATKIFVLPLVNVIKCDKEDSFFFYSEKKIRDH